MVISFTTTTAHAGHANSETNPCARSASSLLSVSCSPVPRSPARRTAISGYRHFPVQRLAGHDHGAAADRGRRALLIEQQEKSAEKGHHVLRTLRCSVLSLLTISAVQAQVRCTNQITGPRTEFVRQCAPRMLGRWEHPEEVCGCLHDHAAAVVEDRDLREALLRGISETGVPTIETDWVPAAKQGEIGADLHQDRQADPAVHVRSGEVVARHFDFGPNRATQELVRTTPLSLIFEPRTSLTCPAGTGSVIHHARADRA